MADTAQRAPGYTPGSDLTPDMRTVGVRRTARYWIGALNTLPVTSIDIGGIAFPLIVERVRLLPTGDTQRIPVLGQIIDLNGDQVAAIKRALKRKVVRWAGKKVDADTVTHPDVEDLTTPEDEDPIISDRRGYILNMPTKAEAAAMQKRGRGRWFTPRDTDEPLANHVYMMKADQRGESFPPPVIETGIEE